MAKLLCPSTEHHDWPISPVYAPQRHSLSEGAALRNGEIVIAEELGRGGFGITYRAYLPANAEWIAVKEFFPAYCERMGDFVVPTVCHQARSFPADTQRFQFGAALLAELNHPHIARLLNCFLENGTAYIAMELLHGQTLARIVEEQGPMEAPLVAEIIANIADGLQAVHALGLLHLDIKPDNLMWLEEGGDRRVVLFDFDLVRKIEASPDRCTRALHASNGTPGYAALEQYTASSPLGPPTDLYALGATAYHLLHGAPPDPSPERALRDGDQVVVEVRDRGLRRAICHCLQLAAEHRPARVGEFLAELHGQSIPAPPVSAMASLPSGAVGTDQAPPERDLLEAVSWSEVQLRTLQCEWPPLCACCCAPADSSRSIQTEGELLEVPYCTPCLRHATIAAKAGFVLVWGIAGGLTLAAIGYACSNLFLGPTGVIIHFSAMAYGTLTFLRAEAMTKKSCCDRKDAVKYTAHHSHGHILGFRNGRYLCEFRALNQGLLL